MRWILATTLDARLGSKTPQGLAFSYTQRASERARPITYSREL